MNILSGALLLKPHQPFSMLADEPEQTLHIVVDRPIQIVNA